MSKEDLTKIIQRNFVQLSEIQLQQEIAEVGEIMQVKAGEILMDSNSYIKFIPLIIDGSIKVSREDEEDGREILLYFLNGGDTCSLSFTCCMMNKKSMIRSEAVEDTTLIRVPTKFMDQWMSKYQSWKNFIMLSYDNKMIELIKALDNITFRDLDIRLKKYLKSRSLSLNTKQLPITHKEISADLNTSREAISRMLKKLEQQGFVELGRNQIKLLN